MLSSAIFPLKLSIVLLDPFSNISYLCVVYIYNDCHQTNQNHPSKMGRTSHLSDANDAFSSLCASFSLILSLTKTTPTNQTKKVQGPGSLLVHAFHYVLNYTLIESFDFRPVESFIVESQYSQYFGLTFPAQILF